MITRDAFNVGKVSGAEMDNHRKITHVHVDLSKDVTNELGFKKPVLGHITVCLSVNLIQGFGDVITLSKTREGLKGIRECRGSLFRANRQPLEHLFLVRVKKRHACIVLPLHLENL